MNQISKKEYIVHTICYETANKLIVDNHYAKGMSNTASHIYGLFKRSDPFKLLGTAVFMIAPQGVALQYGNGTYKDVLTLSRFVLIPDMPKNSASFLLGSSIREIKKLNRYNCLVTYADTSENHTGTIYKATNWTYIGTVKGAAKYTDKDGKLVCRKSTKTRSAATMKRLYKYEGYSIKHKFIYRLTVKKQKPKYKQMNLFV